MAAQTFRTLIARNKRNSLLLIALFMVFFAVVGLLIGNVWGGDWEFGVVVAVVAASVAFLLALLSYYGGSSAILGRGRARQIARADDPQLYNVVEELCIAGGLPLPKIYLINDTALNAFATGRDPKHASIAMTAGLRQKLSRD